MGKVIGKSVNRKDGVEKVTGAARYVDDMKFPNLLHAKVLRSPYAHARILEVDTSRAEALPGVKAVITGRCFPNITGLYIGDRTVLAQEKVRYVGDPVAAVAAETPEVAEQAVELIEVEYEELPGLFNPCEAMQEDAPLIHENINQYNHADFIDPVPDSNISNHFKLRKGDVEAAFAEADYIFEDEYQTPMVQHVPIETHSTIARYNLDGKLKIWASAQSPDALRELLGVIFNKPLNQIQVETVPIGGGFGGKAGLTPETPIAICLSSLVRERPVKLTYSRQEEFHCATVRPGIYANYKTGVKEDGDIVAQEIEYIWDAGAYNDYAVNVTKTGGYSCSGPYEIPNVKADSYCVYTNHPVSGAYRGFGMCEVHWGIEQHLDSIAEELGLSPLEIRLKNALQDGSLTVTSEVMQDVAYSECLEVTAEQIELEKEEESTSPTKLRGKGIAGAYKGPSTPPNASSSALIQILADGSINLIITATEMGQGTYTSLAQIAAETLGVAIDDINVSTPNTDYTPHDWQTVGSRTVFSTGNAVVRAAEDAREQLFDYAAEDLGVEAADLDIEEGIIFDTTEPANEDKRVPISKYALGLQYADGSGRGGQVIGRGIYMPEGITNLDEYGQGKTVNHWTFGCHGAEVEVDTETGQVEVLKMTTTFDLGKVINPQLAEGQLEGGLVQGYGTAILEELIIEEGEVLNNSFVDYKIPTAMDIPEIKSNMLETALEEGPYGARGIGEPAMIPAAPAIANAVYDAIGVRIKELPITPEKILQALAEKESKG
ncbi:xanthine dehydrogenase family protein molybdopterin-binding subunit [Fuchsiella alkaliacetigena]|uniref:xanthine dehydrogenase family protein molybdopterin-binding subunit n=1 Tax=Fuchsiella alkaliacetigena TaxID=957042 RepID=UPI002009E8F7|nr:xanthine dehydrogenase family protein molybdopterin-binding subunit [Fuchsiella alkaliacetigena]MCK8825712.1 xanthine dehydrogenase family protein molybdopterin-binding subunit [Fuchsiella alkaliacetigena]